MPGFTVLKPGPGESLKESCEIRFVDEGPRCRSGLVDMEATRKERYCPTLGMNRVYSISPWRGGFGRRGWRTLFVKIYCAGGGG
ncbi:unnamed protein product [Periconia digitata]|uniref:Uncharacterized protein n=1 Tax=Periconia digitata TaxID=1303443 RepID=A0A9W4U653_9PLEO|nr:unnamed protein product [Periconia digitata]